MGVSIVHRAAVLERNSRADTGLSAGSDGRSKLKSKAATSVACACTSTVQVFRPPARSRAQPTLHEVSPAKDLQKMEMH